MCTVLTTSSIAIIKCIDLRLFRYQKGIRMGIVFVQRRRHKLTLVRKALLTNIEPYDMQLLIQHTYIQIKDELLIPEWIHP